MTESPTPSARQFDMELEIAATPEAVWEALSTEPGLQRWFAPEARVTPGPGGEVLWRWDELHSWPQKIEVWEPNRRLLTRYDSAVPDGAGGQRPLFVDFRLEGRGGRTTLRLVHSGFGPEAAFDEEYDGISSGWPVELQSLRLSLEQHPDLDRQLAWSTALIDLPPGEAWERLTGPAGLACGPRIDALQEGETYAIRTAGGDAFGGEALHCHEREFSGVDEQHGRGFLRFTVERCGGDLQVWVWLAAYGQPQAEMDALQGRWDAMLGELYPQRDRAAAARGA